MDELTALQKVTQSIERLCLENEVLRLLLQENWPIAQRLSPLAVLNQGCTESAKEFHSRNKTSDTRLADDSDVPAPCEQILESLATWIEQMRNRTSVLVEQSKRAL